MLFLGSADQNNVRLCCRALNSAAFDAWIDANFAHRKVYVNDHQGGDLRKLKRLLAREHLCRKLTATLAFHSFDSIDQALLHDVLQDISRLLIPLRLDLESLGDLFRPAESLVHCLVHEVLRAGCKVEAIALGRAQTLRLDILETLGHTNLTDMAKGVTCFEYNAKLWHYGLPGDDDVQRCGELVLIRDMTNLKHLSLQGFWMFDSCVEDSEAAGSLCFLFLLANPCHALVSLELESNVCKTTDIVKVIIKARDTLRLFTAHACTFISPKAYDCIRILQQLQRCPHLRSIALSGRMSWLEGECEEIIHATTIMKHDCIKLNLVSIGGDERGRAPNMDNWYAWETKEDVQKALAVNIDSWSQKATEYAA